MVLSHKFPYAFLDHHSNLESKKHARGRIGERLGAR